MSAGIARRTGTGIAALTAAILVFSACDSENSEDPEAQAEEQAPGSEAEPTPEPDPRTTTFTEPADTEINCDCLADIIGGDGQGQVAIAEDLPTPVLPGQNSGEEPSTTLRVVDGAGETVWSDNSLTWSDGSVSQVVEPKAWATGSALIARQDESTLVGLDWSNGQTLWTAPDVDFQADPELVPERDDVFVLAGMSWNVDGDPFHPSVSAVDATDGSVLWESQRVPDYAISPDGALLLTADYGENGTTLTRVDLADGSTAEVTVDSWRGRGQSLTVHDDGRISAYIGPSEDNERMEIEVTGWDGDPSVTDVEPRDDDADNDSSGVPGHSDAEEVEVHEESGLVLAATVNADGEPETAVMVDADGNQLWDAPADEVLRWRESDSDGADESEEASFSITGAEFATLPDGEPILIVDRTRPSYSESENFGSVEDTEGAAHSAYDAQSGDELWSWGTSARTSSYAALGEDGVFYVAHGGPQTGTGVEDIEPAAATIALLDLRTGEPDWQVEAGETSIAAVHDIDDLVVVQLDAGAPWQVSARTERTERTES